jgi:hypothetical protein
MQMNWVSYLVNELEKDYCEAQDQGYEFHFSWFLILIAFVTWEMPEEATFPEVEPSKPLAMRFTTLWYKRDMVKQWQSNVVFHAYYEVNQEEEGEDDKQEKGEVTPPKDPLTEVETSKKRKVSLQKPSTWKKSRANKPQSECAHNG